MNSVSFFKKTCLSFLFLVLAAPFHTSSYAGDVRDNRFHVKAKGQGILFDRSRNFKIANTGEWGDIVLNGLSGREEALSFKHDQWGGGYEILATLPGKRCDWELLFGQSFAKDHQSKNGLPGVGGGLITHMGFIDGRAHGTSQTFGYFLSAGTPAGANAPATASLDYYFSYYQIAAHASYHMIDQGPFKMDFVGGPSYHHFFQKNLFRTRGMNSSIGRDTWSETNERLYDHLWGGQLGVRGRTALYKKIVASFEQMFGMFYRYSSLRAKQNINHGEGNTGAPFPAPVRFNDLTEGITLHDSDSAFAPQFSSRIELGYEVTRSMSLTFFYQYDLWLHMSRVENPVVSADLTSLHNGATRIRDDEDLASHMIGGKLSLRF
ncbi:MAG: hypothetical protein ABH891_04465 [Candidatus Omnitrophota bacterium]